MKSKWLLIIVGCLAATLSFGQNQNPETNPNPKQQALERFQEQVAQCPMDFWGKVVDQNGAPIEGATATFNLGAKTFDDDADDSKIVVLTDANGLFSLTGKKGGGFSVWISKDGYYSDPDQVSASLPYWRKMMYPQTTFNRNGTWQPFPTEQQPTIFTLTKKGQPAANLIHKFIRVPIPKDGTPVDIDLTKGRVAPAGQGDLEVQTWVTDNGKDVVHPFAWKCLVKVLGGGLQARAGKLDFHAPSSGYQPQDQVAMEKDDGHWKKGMRKQYFLQLSGNRYARVNFEMVNGGNNLLNLRYFLNPTPGDTNLESANWSAAE